MHRLAIFCTLSVLALASCSSKTADGGCGDNASCTAGTICVDSKCSKLCLADGDCEGGEICISDICSAGSRSSEPVISGIDADGSPDPAVDHIDHHIDRTVFIHGQNLTGVDVMLSDGSTEWPLIVCDASDTRVDVELPQGLSSGTTYILTVANQGGSCSANLRVLQGETGAAGADGPQGAMGVQGTTGPAGDAGGGLYVQLEFEETSGTSFADTSPYAATATAGLGGIAAGSTGHSGRAVSFSGGVVSIGSGNSIPDSAQIWVEAWIEPALPLTATRTILVKDGAYAIKQVNDKIMFEVTGELGTCSSTNGIAVAAGQWAHIAGWYDGLRVSVALNGDVHGEPCTNGPIVASAGNAFNIGGQLSGTTVSEDYAGRVDEVRVRGTAPFVPVQRSQYVHWGPNTCVGDARTIKGGFAFANNYNHPGNGVPLCLSGATGRVQNYVGDIVYSTSIQGGAVHPAGINNDTRLQCAVCDTQSPSCFKYDGSSTCPSGYRVQYSGYLYGGHYTHGRITNICVDNTNYNNSVANAPNTTSHVYPTRVHSVGNTGVTLGHQPACAICCQN